MKVLLSIIGLFVGLGLGFAVFYYLPQHEQETGSHSQSDTAQKGEVIGFLPFALLNRADTDYSDYITTLAYFALTIDKDGSILRLTNPQESDPGWHALQSGAADPFLKTARRENITLSLVLFLGDNKKIDMLLTDPVTHAHNLTSDVFPVMKLNGFRDLNIDIESTKEASPGAQRAFTEFLRTIKNDMVRENAGTLTVDISTLDVVRQDLINPREIADIPDQIVLMAYDFHSTASTVTGAVSPLNGAGNEAEYDTATALQKTIAQIPRHKIILGIPSYGYEWETIMESEHSAIIPGTGVVLSNKRAEETVADCTQCKVVYDSIEQEVHAVYFDAEIGAYRELYFPDKRSMDAKIRYARREQLRGLAVWALGYEGTDIMGPLVDYKK